MPESLRGVNSILGQLALFFVEIVFHCSLILSIDRLIATAFPLRYQNWLTDKVTLSLLAFITVLAASYWAIYFFGDCSFHFSHKLRIWAFEKPQCTGYGLEYIDMIYHLSLFGLTSIFDLITLSRLERLRKRFTVEHHDVQGAHESKRRAKKELLLFVQATLTSSMYLIMIICFHVISPTVSTTFSYFLFTTFAWGLAHTIEGVVLIGLNPEIHTHLVSFQKLYSFIKDPHKSSSGQKTKLFSVTKNHELSHYEI
ncbi:unnamed protein product [Cylicocyclus nassatus]|uniref:7TM GPCR serpentine receptor class x (Srx) domain-containing protein n=1 Tax=Cylicocyclus nassatus TaxID=53992 RepID=A0AA36HC60_CYLNA|nr:unnamed protein product [Cylicocyclus nassatus]